MKKKEGRKRVQEIERELEEGEREMAEGEQERELIGRGREITEKERGRDWKCGDKERAKGHWAILIF